MSDVCKKCGWYDGYTHTRECSPARGRAYEALEAEVHVPSTQLGYGYGNVAFYLTRSLKENDTVLQIRVYEDGCYSIEKLFALGNYTKDAMSDLIHTLKVWRQRHEPE